MQGKREGDPGRSAGAASGLLPSLWREMPPAPPLLWPFVSRGSRLSPRMVYATKYAETRGSPERDTFEVSTTAVPPLFKLLPSRPEAREAPLVVAR